MGHVAAAGQLSWRGAWLAALVTLLGSWIQPFASPSSQQALALGGALRTAGPARGVPSGSSDPSGSRGARTGAEAWRVQRPPAALRASLGLAATYLKHVDAGGLAVLGSWRVPDHALLEAAHIVTGMLRAREDLRATLVDAQARVVVMAIDEMTTDVPEFAKLEPADFWDRRARGLGGSARIPVTSCGEENLLHYGGDPYAGESILVHEFAHTLHQLALGSEHDQRLRSTYEAAMAAGLWEGRYAARDHGEYWAEGVQSWFGANRQHDHDHNHVDTREELADYDPGLARLVESVFGANSWRYLPPNDRAYADHLRDFDASSAPRFAWPEHLPRWSQEDEAWHQFLKRRPLEDVLAWTQRLAEAGA